MNVTAAKYAEIRGRSKQWVSDQIELGMPALGIGRSGSKYRIDSAAAMDWEVQKTKEKAEAESGGERERLARAQAEKYELENARRRRELVTVAYVSDLFNSQAADLTGRLEALPGRVANDLAGISDPAAIRARLLEETRAIRTGVAEYIRKLAGAGPQTSDDTKAAAAPKRRRPIRRKARRAK